MSLGPQKTAIPALEGMDENIATITIRRIGLQVGDVAGSHMITHQQNTIVAQTPLPGATDVQGPGIALLVAQASPPQQEASVMPDLTGETFSMAALTILHCWISTGAIAGPIHSSAGDACDKPGRGKSTAIPRYRFTGTQCWIPAESVFRSLRNSHRTDSLRRQPHFCGIDNSAYCSTMMLHLSAFNQGGKKSIARMQAWQSPQVSAAKTGRAKLRDRLAAHNSLLMEPIEFRA